LLLTCVEPNHEQLQVEVSTMPSQELREVDA
jgi:hypothetical protein